MNRVLVCLGLAMLGSVAYGLQIIGGLSNFDVYNEEPGESCGFEIEIHGIDPSDVYHTYDWSAFGAPTVSSLGSKVTLVRYFSETERLPPGSYTHFGVSLPYFVPTGSIFYRWLFPAPPGIPEPVKVVANLPTHQSELVTLPDGSEAVRDVVTNETPDGDDGITFWILPWAKMVNRVVELEELMRDGALLDGSIPMGGGSEHMDPERLDPQDKWFNDDLAGDDTASAVFWFEVYEDVLDGNGEHMPGDRIGTLIDATVTAVPEPATALLVGVPLVAFLARRRK